MRDRLTVAFGPVMPGWGSWEWIGAELLDELSSEFEISSFTYDTIPTTKLVVLVKHPPPKEWFRRVSQSASVIYCPIDFYGSPVEIDSDGTWLSQTRQIIIHAERLRRYFAPYSPVIYMDHHVRFVAKELVEPNSEGPILWVGVHTNLPPLVEWVNQHGLPLPLVVLTNWEEAALPSPLQLGFRPGVDVKIERWTPTSHLNWLRSSRAAIDIKGGDFRSRHKPPAKALDFLASGLPLAMNANSSSTEHLAQMGFSLADPSDRDRWFSKEYAAECRRFGSALRELLSRQRIGLRWKHLLRKLAER